MNLTELITRNTMKKTLQNRQFDSVFTNEDSNIPDVTDTSHTGRMTETTPEIDANKVSGPDGIPAKI